MWLGTIEEIFNYTDSFTTSKNITKRFMVATPFWLTLYHFITALHGMQTRSSDENSVYLFQPIIARSSSAVTPSEKSSINANRKFTMRFPMSLRRSSYVAPKSPKGGLKNTKRPISIKKYISLEESLLQSFFVWKLSAAKLWDIHLPN